jgi:hypothetical protein
MDYTSDPDESQYIDTNQYYIYGYGPKVPDERHYYSDYNTTSLEYDALHSTKNISTDAWPGPTFIKKPKEITLCYCNIL